MASYNGEWERSLLAELNRARTKPRDIAAELTALKACYEGVMFKIPGTNKVIRTTEGVAAVNNAIAFLEARSPISAFRSLSEGLSKAAYELIVDNGTKGLVGNTFSDGTSAAQRWVRYGQWKGKIGENLYFNLRDPKLIVYQWIIDDNNGNRPNRKSIFDEQFSVVGIAQGPHIQHDFMVIVTFAAEFDEGVKGVVPQVGNRSSPSSTTVQSALRKTEEETLSGDDNTYIIQTDDLQVPNSSSLKLTAKGKVLTLGKTFKVDGKSKRQNFQWQLPFSFNARNVNAQLIDGKVIIKIPKPAAGQIASNDSVVVGTYQLAPGSDQEKVTVEAKQSKEAFILRPIPSKYEETVEVAFSADIVTLTCTHRGPDGKDVVFQNPLRLPFVLSIDLFNVQNRPDGIIINVAKSVSVEEIVIPIH